MNEHELNRKRKTALFLAGGAVGALVFLLIYGTAFLDPTNVDWLLSGGDLSQHYLGWAFFRADKWRFPLGMVGTLVYPHDVSIVYTDSIPLLAILFKLLSPLLPAQFQYFGWWGLLSYTLTAALGALLVDHFCRDWFVSLCGALLFAFSPYMLTRMFAHTALAGHWLILAGLYLVICRDAWQDARRRGAAWIGLFALVSGIHLYFVPMLGIMLLMDCAQEIWRHRDRTVIRNSVLLLCVCAAVSGAELVVLGAFSGVLAGQYDGGSFGLYSANLNTFLAPMPGSKMEQATAGMFTYIGGQNEGMGYLGLGLLLLATLALVLWAWKSRRVNGALLGIFAAHMLFAFSTKLVWNDTVLLDIPLHWRIARLLGIFRSSGRFIWVSCYLILLFALATVWRWLPKKAAWAVIGLCVVLQLWDLSGAVANKRAWAQSCADSVFTVDEGWQELAQQGYEHILFLSPDYTRVQFHKTIPVAYAARLYDMTLSDFYTARVNYKVMESQYAQSCAELEAGEPRAGTIYVLDPALGDEAAHWQDVLQVREMDGNLIGVPRTD